MKVSLLVLLLTVCVCVRQSSAMGYFTGNGKMCVIILYDRADSAGRLMILGRATRNLAVYRFSNVPDSVQIIRCQWELFDRTYYRGKSVVLGIGRHDLRGSIGYNKVSSLKPYGSAGVCSASGDPHFYTFDHKTIHFMGICTYTLARPCKVYRPGLKRFHVMIKGERRGNNRVSWTKYLLVDVDGMRFKLGKNRVVFLNGLKINLPYSKKSTTVHFTGKNVELKTKFGLKVTFDGHHMSSVSLPTKYKNQMCGLCGNWNGKKADDMKDAKGVLHNGYAAVGNSWVVQGADQICHKEPEMPPKCTKGQERLIQSNGWCGMLRGLPFSKCHSSVPYQFSATSCHYDLCALGLKKQVLCTALEAYAEQCKTEGVSLNWRTRTGCPLPCLEPNTHYRFCTSACPNTCLNRRAEKTCKEPCLESCACKPGFVMSGDKCVPQTQCGCQYAGQYRKRGESWIGQACRKRYTCKSGRVVTTRLPGCLDKNSKCKVEKGSRGCHCKKLHTKVHGKCKPNVIKMGRCPLGYQPKIMGGVFICVLKYHRG